MTPDLARRAAERLLAARRRLRPLGGLPENEAPASLDAGYAIQKAFIACSGDLPCGYKIGATSKRAQDFLGIADPIFGRVLESGLFPSGASLDPGAFCFALVEPEFAFRMARDLPAPNGAYGRGEVADAVATLVPAIEIVCSGWADWTTRGAAALIADNGVHGALLLGEERADWRGIDLAAHRVRLEIDGVMTGEGSGAECLGHPLEALTWLAGEAGRRCGGLKAGEIVTTGVVTPFVALSAGQTARADFGALGTVSLSYP